MEDHFFDHGGSRDEVIAALDASIAAHPSGVLHGAKTYVRGILAALPDQWVGCSIRWLPSPAGGWTISMSYCTAPPSADSSPGEARP